MMDIPVHVVNVPYELHQIIEKVGKNYIENKWCDNSVLIVLKITGSPEHPSNFKMAL